MPTLQGLFQVGIDILNSTVSSVTKGIVVQTGDADKMSTDTDNVQWWQHVGFTSRPSKPQTGKTAGKGTVQAVVIRRSDHDACIASRDLRGQELAGSLSDGETCIYAPGSDGNAQARVLLKANGNLALYTAQGNAAGGQSVTVQCNSDGTINLASPLGAIAIASDKIVIMRGTSGMQLDANGMTVIGQGLSVNGGSVSLGAGLTTGVATQATMAGMMTALAALNTALAGITGLAGIAITSAQTTAIATAASALTLTLPTAFSQSVKAAL